LKTNVFVRQRKVERNVNLWCIKTNAFNLYRQNKLKRKDSLEHSQIMFTLTIYCDRKNAFFFFYLLTVFFHWLCPLNAKLVSNCFLLAMDKIKKKKGINLEGSTSNLGAYSWHEKCNLVSSFLRREKVSPDSGIERKNHYFHIFQLTNWLIFVSTGFIWWKKDWWWLFKTSILPKIIY